MSSPNSVMNRFGEKLRVLRKRRGLSMRQLGDALNVDHGHIGRMERGENRPSVAILLEISRLFDVSADVLIKDELELD